MTIKLNFYLNRTLEEKYILSLSDDWKLSNCPLYQLSQPSLYILMKFTQNGTDFSQFTVDIFKGTFCNISYCIIDFKKDTQCHGCEAPEIRLSRYHQIEELQHQQLQNLQSRSNVHHQQAKRVRRSHAGLTIYRQGKE